MTDPRAAPSADRFYVGYLALPRAHRAALALLVPALLVGVLALAGAMAGAQRDPGDAVWASGEQAAWTGVLTNDPFPVLFGDDGEAYLLVELGKRGAQSRPQLAGAPARAEVRGWRLEREGRHIIELAPEADAVRTIGGPGEPPAREDLGPVVVRGEILDGKCYLGAMKPGDGKGHRSCAILCLRGGLPPMVAGPDNAGGWSMRLLVVDGSTTLPEPVLGLVATPVEIRGRAVRRGPLVMLEAAAEDIQPIP